MSENWDADARVGVPMMQVIAKQVSQHKHSPREVRRIIDAQWLDEESKQQLRETFRVTDADLAAAEREAADEERRLTRERYGIAIPAGPCDCDAEFLVHPSGRIECQNCGAEWAADEVRKVIDAQWLDEESKQQLRETFRVTDADLAANESEKAQAEAAVKPEETDEPAAASERETGGKPEGAGDPAAASEGEGKPDEAGEPAAASEGEAGNGGESANGRQPAEPPEAEAKPQAANGREVTDPPGEAGQPRTANERGARGKRGKANKREASGQRQATGEREPAKQRETAGQAGTAD